VHWWYFVSFVLFSWFHRLLTIAPSPLVILLKRVLAPGESLTPEEQDLLRRICDAYYLPAWCSAEDYRTLFEEQGIRGELLLVALTCSLGSSCFVFANLWSDLFGLIGMLPSLLVN
jgi:hypothetical protein